MARGGQLRINGIPDNCGAASALLELLIQELGYAVDIYDETYTSSNGYFSTCCANPRAVAKRIAAKVQAAQKALAYESTFSS